jgi:hypothetical protein
LTFLPISHIVASSTERRAMDYLLKALISVAVLLVSAAFLVVAIVLAKTQGLCTDAGLGGSNHLTIAPCDTDARHSEASVVSVELTEAAR